MNRVGGLFLAVGLALALSTMAPASSAQSGERAKLLADLTAKADAAKTGSPAIAEQLYGLVLWFNPQDRAIVAKQTGSFALSGAEAAMAGTAVSRVIRNSTMADLSAQFPTVTPEAELVMLRILLDERLVGNGLYTSFNSNPPTPPFSLRIFLAVPSLTIAEVKAAYGPPTEDKTQRGYEGLTYGKLRVISDATGKVVAVTMAPSP